MIIFFNNVNRTEVDTFSIIKVNKHDHKQLSVLDSTVLKNGNRLKKITK